MGCDRKPRNRDIMDAGLKGSFLWKTNRVGCREVDDQRSDRYRLVRQPDNPDLANFDQPGEGCRWPHQQAAMRAFQVNSVVADKARKARTGMTQERQCKVRFAGA